MASGQDRNRTSESDLLLMARVARKYYTGGQSKSEIADELYLSRFKVARLLETAQQIGVVTLTIGLDGDADEGLARELGEAFGLKRALVIDDRGLSETQLLARLGGATTGLMAEILCEEDVVGVASTRTMMGLEDAWVALPRATFVQITGALPRSDADDVISAIRSLTRMASGRAKVFYAPIVASSAEARDSYLAQPETQEAFTAHSALSVFVTGVGDWSTGLSLIHDALPASDQDEARALGAVAEIAGVPIDEAGRPVRCAARDRIVAPDLDQLKGTRDRIAVVYDARRARATRIAVVSGISNVLVTHRAHAEALLAL